MNVVPSNLPDSAAGLRRDPLSHGLWERSAPPAPLAAPLAGKASAQVAIVGAGYTGLSAALHLAQAGVDAVVLDAADVGFGGSGRNVGLVNAGFWLMPDDIVDALGIRGERLLQLLGDGPRVVFELIERHAIECEAVRAGTLHCGVGRRGAEELRERERQWRARAAPVRLLDAGETARMVGTTAYSAALLDKRAGTVQPLAYARGLAHAAIGAGARVHTLSPVVEASESADGWVLSTPGGRVRARSVIVATNAYTSGVWPELAGELVRFPYFNLATAPLPETLRETILPGGQGIWDTRQILSSLRMDAAGRLVFGSVGALRGAGTRIHRDWGRRALRRLFPALGDIAFEHEWFGQIGMTQDSLPRFHRLARNLVSMSGYNGRGIAPGTYEIGAGLAHLAGSRF